MFFQHELAGCVQRFFLPEALSLVIPKEIRRTMRLRDGAPLLITLTRDTVFCMGVDSAKERYIGK